MVTVEPASGEQPQQNARVEILNLTYNFLTGNPNTVVCVVTVGVDGMSYVFVSFVTTRDNLETFMRQTPDANGVVLVENASWDTLVRRTYILTAAHQNVVDENQHHIREVFERPGEDGLREQILEEIGIVVMAVYNGVNPV